MALNHHPNEEKTDKNPLKIAILLTVFNRREKTISCLRHLFSAVEYYHSDEQHQPLSLEVFLTDDGCTDGTSKAVRQAFPKSVIHILQGTGNLFWAGGMRLAWQAAIDTKVPWTFYLLLNDDTNIFPNAFNQLLNSDRYGEAQTGRHGLSSGITCQPGNYSVVTYGGLNFVNKTRGRQQLVLPCGHPQHIDLAHANILLVHHSVVDKIGIFSPLFRHGCADMDYSMIVHSHGLPIFSTSDICGECECDHDSQKAEIFRLMKMSLHERKQFVKSPIHSDQDYLTFVRRNLPLRYPIAWIMRTIRLYFPSIYYHLTSFRGVYGKE